MALRPDNLFSQALAVTELPSAFPTYLVVREGKLVRYRIGAAGSLEELLP